MQVKLNLQVKLRPHYIYEYILNEFTINRTQYKAALVINQKYIKVTRTKIFKD